MDTIEAVGRLLQSVFDEVAEDSAKGSGFVRRRSKLTGGRFAKTLVFGWLSNPDATLEELAQTAAAVGVRISPQGLDQRFSEAGAEMMRAVLEAAAAKVVIGEAVGGVLGRFEGVYILDSTTISLPAEFREAWPGCGGSTPASGRSQLKLQVMIDLKRGGMRGPEMSSGRVHDGASGLQAEPLPPGSLRVTDLGYFSLRRLREMGEQGAYWLSKPSATTLFAVPEGQGLDLDVLLAQQSLDELDMPVLAGGRERLSCRLVGERVPAHVAQERRRRLRKEAKREGRTPSRVRLARADWTLLITNAPQRLLPLPGAIVLYRARWQIEMLFKRWKSCGGVASWRSRKPWRILCEVYAKLLAMLAGQWMLTAGCWRYPDRSLTKALATVRRYAMVLAGSLSHMRRLRSALRDIRNCLAAGCRIGKRHRDPATHQLLEALSSTLGGAPMAA